MQLPDTSEYGRIEIFRLLFWECLPKPAGWTNDYEDLFNDSEEEKLDSIISAFEKESTTQICIVTLDTIYTTKENFDALHCRDLT